MMKLFLYRYTFFIAIMIGATHHSVAASAPIATVTGVGAEASVDVIIWLNGDGPLTGQLFHVTGGHRLSVTPTVSNHTYRAMGLKILTPGVTVASGCIRTAGDRCIFSASKNQPAIIQLLPQNHYLFLTSSTYDGNLGGVSGADAICTSVAQHSGNPNINTLTFKAVLLSAARFPCDNTGRCGGQHVDDWPLLANTQYLNPDNTASPLLMTNQNLSFPQPGGDITTIEDEFGNVNPQVFWSGIQSILTADNDNANIVAWAFDNVNPDSETIYIQNLAACNNWIDNTSNFIGSDGQSGTQATPIASPIAGIWGNYFFQLAGSPGYIETTWVSSFQFYCNQFAGLVCAS